MNLSKSSLQAFARPLLKKRRWYLSPVTQALGKQRSLMNFIGRPRSWEPFNLCVDSASKGTEDRSRTIHFSKHFQISAALIRRVTRVECWLPTRRVGSHSFQV